MAAKTNLTFTELNAELTTPAFTFDTDDVVLSLKDLTGITFTGLGDAKVLQAIKKLLDICYAAQLAANDGLAEGELLDTFNVNSLILIEDQGIIEARYSQDFVISLSNVDVTGQNI